MTTHTKTFGALRPQAADRKKIFGRLTDYAALYRQRRALARLDAQALADIGLSQSDAQSEAKRPIWDVPSNWHA